MYNIGQFRRSQLNAYSIPLIIQENEISTQPTNIFTASDFIFQNTCINLSNDKVLNIQNCYYLSFKVSQKENQEQLFYLKLRNTNLIQDNEQLIDSFRVAQGNGYVCFEIIIAPNSTYNQILWELQRTALDYLRPENRKIELTEIPIYEKLIDVLSVLKSSPNYYDLEHFTKIGIQGPPSLLMCINRQQIRIGKSGIYEINNGIDINSISFVPKVSSNNELDYFIMDFEY